MTTRIAIRVAAATVLATSFGWAGLATAQTPDNNAGMTQQANGTAQGSTPTLPDGFKGKQLNEESDIKSELANLTNDAVTKDHFDNFIGNLAKQDKERVGDYKNGDFKTLNGRIDQIREAWKNKYGKDFDLNDQKVVFNQTFPMTQGEVSDPTTALNNWPVPAYSMNGLKDMAKSAADAAGMNNGDKSNTGDHENKDVGKQENDAKLDNGRNVALFVFPEGHGLPKITVSLIHELPDQWRVDVPNNRTGQQIHDDLLTQLTWVGEHVNDWPSDVNDAYRIVAQRAVAALYGVPSMDSAAGNAAKMMENK